MAKKPKDKSKQESLLEGLDFLQDIAYAEEEKAYARRHTDFQSLANTETPPPEDVGGEEEVRAEVNLKHESPTVSAGTDKFKNHFKATAFGRNTSSIYAAEAGSLCPHCKFSILEECTSFSGKTCEFFV